MEIFQNVVVKTKHFIYICKLLLVRGIIKILCNDKISNITVKFIVYSKNVEKRFHDVYL